MAKEEKNKFQLNKRNDHGFDISKGIKRKFDLTKDTDEQVVPPVKSQPAGTTVEPNTISAASEEKSIRKWLWVIAIIIIALLVWWLWPSSTESKDVEEVAVEEVANPVDAATDKVTTQEEQPAPDVQSEEVVQTETSSPIDNAVPTTSSTPVSTPNATPSAVVTTSVTDVHISNDIEAEAFKVIHGDYGDGQERKDKLGTKYQTIQNRVNELKREGVF